MPARPVARRLGLVAAAAALVIGLTACDPPLTIATTVTYDCQINTNNALLGTISDTIDGSYDVTAPQAVAPGSNFTVKVTPRPFTMNASTSGGTVSQLTNVVWRVAIPAGTTLSAQQIDGGTNVGPTAPTSSVSGGNVLITVPGPIVAGVEATFPTLTMVLATTGTLGTKIIPKIGGTSYAAPGLTLNAKVTGTILGTLNPSLACFPSPSVGLHSILISNDVDSPAITINAPVKDQVIVRNAVVPASFSCNDGTGVGVRSCVGTVANGAAINTSTLGAKTFSVTATDNEGKFGTATVSYTVVAA
jgi:dehydratase